MPKQAVYPNETGEPHVYKVTGDEAHHAVAETYRRVIDRALHRNPMVRIFGVTATPNRGDRKGLREVFSNVSDQIRIGELIASGHLVKPRTFVIDVGVQDKLRQVSRTASDST